MASLSRYPFSIGINCFCSEPHPTASTLPLLPPPPPTLLPPTPLPKLVREFVGEKESLSVVVRGNIEKLSLISSELWMDNDVAVDTTLFRDTPPTLTPAPSSSILNKPHFGRLSIIIHVIVHNTSCSETLSPIRHDTIVSTVSATTTTTNTATIISFFPLAKPSRYIC